MKLMNLLMYIEGIVGFKKGLVLVIKSDCPKKNERLFCCFCRIRVVAAAAAASSIARVPSIRRLTSNKGAVSQYMCYLHLPWFTLHSLFVGILA